MRVKVNADGRKIRILLPNGLVFNNFTALIAEKNSVGEAKLTRAQYRALFSALRKFSKEHGSFELVNVNTHDGTQVKIVL